jgi:beta-lactamase class A
VNTPDLPTTSDDIARLMAALATGEGLSPAAGAHARSLLEAQEWRWGIPAGLPEGVTVGNKTGTWDSALHDAAYVDSPNGEYVIAVLTDGTAGWDVIARVSAAAWHVLGEPPDGG